MQLSQRALNLSPSSTLAAAAKAKALKAQGVDVLSLTVGEPDFATPQHIQRAATAAIEAGKASFYTPTAGILPLREAVVQYMAQYYGLTYDVQETLVTDGAKFALYTLFQVILNAGDEVLIPTPYWVSYGEQVKLAEGTPIFVASTAENEYKVTVAQLEAARTPRTKAMIINSPSNPTGMIYSREELMAIGEWAVAHDILIIADDIYGRLVYEGHEFVSIATLSEEIRQQTIVINGVSKTYAMTGWRIGFAVGNREIIQAMINIASQSTSNPTAVSQYAALEALTGDQQPIEEMRQVFAERLARFYPLVAEIPGFTVTKPQGAFYLFPNVKEAMTMCGYDDIDAFVDALLYEANVAVVAGSGFGANENLRLSYAADWATLEKSVARIKAFVEKHSKK